MILAGDIGGTKTNLGLFDAPQGALVKVADKRYVSHEHTGLDEIVKDFVSGTKAKITAASFGIAGPVVDNRVHTGNLPWIIDGATLAKELGLDRVRLLNDLEATAHGVSMMLPVNLERIYAGVPYQQAHRAVIAAGTGLGEAVLFWTAPDTCPWPPRLATPILRRKPISTPISGNSSRATTSLRAPKWFFPAGDFGPSTNS